MKPYLYPAIVFFFIVALLGISVVPCLLLSAAFGFYCRHSYCADMEKDKKLLKEIREYQSLTSVR